MKSFIAVSAFLIVISLIIPEVNAQFQWGEDGIVARHDFGLEWDESLVTDLTGNTYVLWSDCRTGDRNVYAQMYSLDGQPLWEESGIHLGSAIVNSEMDLSITLTENGGFTAGWCQASETGGIKIVTQRVDAGGNLLWGQNANVLFDIQEWVTGLKLISDGASGILITWTIFDASSELELIYALRIDPAGNVFPGWDPNGVLVRDAPTDGITLIDFDVCSDDESGIIVTWNDVGGGSDIYAQRVSSAGELLWGDGVLVCGHASTQEQVTIIPDGSGGAFCSWSDENYGGGPKIVMQRLDSEGNSLWTLNGILVCFSGIEQEHPVLTSDGMGGVIAAFEQDNNIFGQRIDGEGNLLWPQTGIGVCNLTAVQNDVAIAGDGSGNVYIAWRDHRNTMGEPVPEVYAQYLNSAGHAMWQVNGILIREGGYYPYPAIGYLPDGGAMFAWHNKPGVEDGIYVQKVDAQGNIYLTANGEPVIELLGGGAYNNMLEYLPPDKIIAVYGDSRYYNRLFFQIFDLDGNITLTEYGLPATTINNNPSGCKITATSDGGTIIVWKDTETSQTRKIRAQKIDNQGNVLWHPDGIEMTGWDNLQFSPYVCSDGEGGAYVAFHSYNGLSCTASDIYIQRVSADGTLPWGDVAEIVTYDSRDKHLYGIVEDGDGGAIINWTWEISIPPQNYDIYAARYLANGDSAWLRIISDLPCDQRHSNIISSRDGGAIIAWEDSRESNNHKDIFAQKIASNGDMVWIDDGVPVRVYDDESSEHVLMVEDEEGYIYYVFEDGRGTGYRSLWCMRMTPEGQRMFHNQGIMVSAHSSFHDIVNLVDDGQGGIIAVWDDDDSGAYNRDIYISHLNSEGELASAIWQEDGNPVGGGFGYRKWSNAVSDGQGGAIISWMGPTPLLPTEVSQAYDSHLYIQRMNEYVTDIEAYDPVVLPAEFTLDQNYPNPFNAATNISFQLQASGYTELKVYDITGREAASLVTGHLSLGQHSIEWNAEGIASGIYIVQLKAGSFKTARKMVLMK